MFAIQASDFPSVSSRLDRRVSLDGAEKRQSSQVIPSYILHVLPQEAEARRAAILLELRKANDIEMDAAARKAEAEAKRAAALHKLLRDEQLAADRTAMPAAVRASCNSPLPS